MAGLITGAGMFVAGLGTGMSLGLGRLRKASEKKPVCGCKHSLAFHDPKTGECHEEVLVASTGSTYSGYVQCNCRQYTGPEKLPDFYAPEIAN